MERETLGQAVNTDCDTDNCVAVFFLRVRPLKTEYYWLFVANARPEYFSCHIRTRILVQLDKGIRLNSWTRGKANFP